VPILVRTRDDSQLAELKAAGASEVVPELLESSLMLASHALIMLGLPDHQVQARIDEVRRNRYRLLHGFSTRQRRRRRSILTDRADLVDRQVRAVILLFLAQAQPVYALDHAIHQQSARQRHSTPSAVPIN
jgi:voltage-gated potassium channel Kch